MTSRDGRTCIHCNSPLEGTTFPSDNPRFCGWMCASEWAADRTHRHVWEEQSQTWILGPLNPYDFIV